VQDGDLPFNDVLSEETLTQALVALRDVWLSDPSALAAHQTGLLEYLCTAFGAGRNTSDKSISVGERHVGCDTYAR
jgi:hypothetical protein